MGPNKKQRNMKYSSTRRNKYQNRKKKQLNWFEHIARIKEKGLKRQQKVAPNFYSILPKHF